MSYDELRHEIRTGDVIAFSGKGRTSWSIKAATRSVISHVGVAIRREQHGFDWVDVIESTSLDGAVGVQVIRLSAHVARYGGQLWWLGLRELIAPDREAAAIRWAFRELAAGYDLVGALRAGLDWPGLPGEDDPSRWFCSELAAELLRRAGVLPASIDPSEWVPRDLVRASIYRRVEQLAGEPLALAEANNLDPLAVDRAARDRWL